MDYKKVLVIYSGGLDSTVALYWAKKHFEEVGAVSFLYGSKHNKLESNCANINACELNIDRKIIELDFTKFLKSDLLNMGGEIPIGEYNKETMSKIVVPFRNGIFLSIAAGYGESEGYEAIILGNHSGDHEIYKDCRGEFIKKISEAIKAGTDHGIELISPFCDLSKSEIVKLGASLNVDFSKTYSCYKGGEVHCGECLTCRERKKAFIDAGVEDITEYLK